MFNSIADEFDGLGIDYTINRRRRSRRRPIQTDHDKSSTRRDFVFVYLQFGETSVGCILKRHLIMCDPGTPPLLLISLRIVKLSLEIGYLFEIESLRNAIIYVDDHLK